MIACATKHIQETIGVRLQNIKRSEAESDLRFIGFIIFENKLKPNTKAVIKELNDASIRCIMCTGDNILTAISVGRECCLIDPTAHCFVPHLFQGIIPILAL